MEIELETPPLDASLTISRDVDLSEVIPEIVSEAFGATFLRRRRNERDRYVF